MGERKRGLTWDCPYCNETVWVDWAADPVESMEDFKQRYMVPGLMTLDSSAMKHIEEAHGSKA